jgi:peptidase M28-like protein
MVHRFGSVLFQEKTPAISEDWLRSRRNRIVAAAAAAFLIAAAFLAAYQIQPPDVAPAGSPETEFSAARAVEHLKVIAAQPHPTGSPENDAVRDYLLKQMAGLGFDPQVQTATVVRYETKWRGPAVAANIHNVVARLEGSRSASAEGPSHAKALMLAAHYDSVSSGPGASDDGSGTATLLETARALKAGPPLANDVIFLFTDGEELGLLGAQAFVDEHPWSKDVGLALNFEARGACGPVTMFETSDDNARLIQEFAAAAPHPVSSSLMYEAYKMLPNDTDLSIFKQAGMAGLNFAYVGCWPRYHTMGDSLENLDLRSLQHDGDYAVELARRFGNADISGLVPSADGRLGRRANDEVYFNLGGSTVHYSARWAVPLALVAILAFIAALTLGIRKGRLGPRGILGGVLLWPLAALLASLAPEVLWVVLRKLGFASLLPYGMAYNGNLYTAGFVALAAALFSTVYIVAARKVAVENLVAGALVWWALAEFAIALLVPGASFIVVWPLVAAALAMEIEFFLPGKPTAPRHALTWAVPTLTGILLFVPLIYLLIELLETTGLVVIILTVSLLLGLFIPFIHVISSEDGWPIPVAACGVAAGFIIFAMVASGYNASHARADSIFYLANADTGKAVWGSTDPAPDAWTAQFFGRSAARADLSEFFRLDESFISSPPEMKTLGDVTLGDERFLRFAITSPRQARVVWVSVPQGNVLEGSVDGKPVPASPPEGRRGNWGFVFVGVPDEGITLVLHAKAAQPLAVRVVDQSNGLPALPGESFKPRPESFMPAPGPFDSSTLVSKTFAFESRSATTPPARAVGERKVETGAAGSRTKSGASVVARPQAAGKKPGARSPSNNPGNF